MIVASRPLRDLLQTSDDGLIAATNRVWKIATKRKGAWCRVRQERVLRRTSHDFLRSISLRAVGRRLDLRLEYDKGVEVLAVSRRLLVRVPWLPLTVTAVMCGRPLAKLIQAPFLDDPAITIQGFPGGEGARRMEIRCRCPSDLLICSRI